MYPYILDTFVYKLNEQKKLYTSKLQHKQIIKFFIILDSKLKDFLYLTL